MNEIIIVGGVDYATEKIETGIDTISFTLIDPPEDIEAAFGDVKELKVSDPEGEAYGEYPDVEYESVTITADGKVTVTIHILTEIEKQIRELQTIVTEHDEAITTAMFGGETK